MIHSHTWLIAIAGLFVLSGFAAGIWSGGSAENAQTAVALAVLPTYVLTYLWMKADARERAAQCPPGATPLIVGLYPIAVLYHLIATRPGWDKAIATLRFLGYAVLVMALHSVATYAGYLVAK